MQGTDYFAKSNHLLELNDQILILAGKGNNGGDGIVLARYLKNNGYDVQISISPRRTTNEDSKGTFSLLSSMWL